jgi:hypothetical protein
MEGIGAALLLSIVVCRCSYPPEPVILPFPFAAVVWRNDTLCQFRKNMLHDLFRRYDFRGQSPQEVEELLGPATHHHSSATSENFDYYLRCRGGMERRETIEFVVKDGRVIRWQTHIL